MPQSVHISKEIFYCSRRCSSEPSRKRRRCVPQAIYSSPSSLDAKRDQCCTQSTRGIHIHALWRGQEHAVRDLSRRGCPAGNQTSTHHLASTKRRKQPCGSVGQVAGNPRMTC